MKLKLIENKNIIDDYLHAMNHASEECYKYVGGKKTYTKDQLLAYLNKIITDDSRYDFLMMIEDQIIGEVVLNNISSDDSAHIRIAIFDEEHMSKGYGKIAIKETLNFGFNKLGLHRIDLEVYDFNKRGIHVYEQIGFKQEGVLRDAYKDNGYHDIILMGILEDEFKG